MGQEARAQNRSFNQSCSSNKSLTGHYQILWLFLRWELFTYRELWEWIDNTFDVLPIIPGRSKIAAFQKSWTAFFETHNLIMEIGIMQKTTRNPN